MPSGRLKWNDNFSWCSENSNQYQVLLNSGSRLAACMCHPTYILLLANMEVFLGLRWLEPSQWEGSVLNTFVSVISRPVSILLPPPRINCSGRGRNGGNLKRIFWGPFSIQCCNAGPKAASPSCSQRHFYLCVSTSFVYVCGETSYLL